jgi:hypothetical protein
MKKVVALWLIGAGLVLSVQGQTKKEGIVRLLNLTDTKPQAAQMFDLMLPGFEALAPQAPTAIWTMFREKLNIDSFLEMFIAVYDKYLTHDEVKGLIQFYESPIGRRLVEITPQISQESFRIGQEWGQKIGQSVAEELIKQGYY